MTMNWNNTTKKKKVYRSHHNELIYISLKTCKHRNHQQHDRCFLSLHMTSFMGYILPEFYLTVNNYTTDIFPFDKDASAPYVTLNNVKW